MKLTITLFAITYSFMSLQIYSNDAGFFDSEFTRNDYKFIAVQMAVIFVSLLNLVQEKCCEISKMMLVVVLNIISLIACYEIAIERQTKIGVAMTVSFCVSLLFPYLVKSVLKNAPNIFQKIIDTLPDIINQKLKQWFSIK